ncbi:MAG TPA: GH92 family glycosyl hydrolase [Mycobacteriales bacterium]|nr:GH92 family glycosyl hydrolase [Mycobacteriales bacterium]
MRLALLAVAVALVAGGAPAVAGGPRTAPAPDLAALVDPMVGTVAPGFVVPGAATPFGMTQVSPDTRGEVAYSGYLWTDPQVQGFSHVHLSGPGVKKAGDIPLMPTVGPVLSSDPVANGAAYDHATETAEPGYYSVRLASGTAVELTATTRTGMQRYTFPPAPQANVLLDVSRSIEGVHAGALQVVDADTVRGWSRGRYQVWFEADFSRPFTSYGTWAGSALSPGSKAAAGQGVGGWVSFEALTRQDVTVKVGISFVDAAGARRNLATESRGFDLDRVRSRARAAWNAELAKVRVEGGTEPDRRTFTTALYHALLHPNAFSDVDGRYRGFDHRVHRATGRVQYANFSSWDTYKAQNQLLASVWPGRYREMLLSLLADARQGGRLPRWGEQDLDASHMSGDPAIPMIVDGYCRGVLDGVARTDLEGLYAAMKDLVAKREAAWHSHGYLPLQTSSRGAGTTLEYGVADFALALMADGLGRGGDARRFAGLSTAYRRLLDPETAWVRPRNDDGSWLTPFDATDETGFQEGNSWQYSWLVPHDARGLFARMGGDSTAVERLDTHFSEALGSVVPVAVGEAQSRATLFGLAYRTNQYAPGNEHDLQTPWMYPFARQPWKTQSVHRQVQGVFRPTVEGLPGNDDLGSLSAWYVWSALGLGPVTPGAPFYVIGSPLFPKAVLDLPGRDLVVLAPGTSLTGKYVQSATLGGRRLDRAWVTHQQLRTGRVLALEMGTQPSTTWATAASAVPPSLTGSRLGAFACTPR